MVRKLFVVLFCQVAFVFSGLASSEKTILFSCSQEIYKILEKSIQEKRSPKDFVKTFEELILSFSFSLQNNLITDEDISFFNLYLNTFFPYPNRIIELNHAHSEISKIISNKKIDPKINFSNQTYTVEQIHYKSSKDLDSFIANQILKSSQIKNALLNPEDHILFWSKILQIDKTNSKEEIKEILPEILYQYISENFWESSEKFLTESEREEQKIDRFYDLYYYLLNIKSALEKENKNTLFVSQVIANIIHILPFQDEKFLSSIKVKDGLKKINNFRRLFSLRNELSQKLGNYAHYDHLLSDLNLRIAPFEAKKNSIQEKLDFFEKEILNDSTNKNIILTTQTVRHLSTLESSYRSQLGNDCSSNFYLRCALFPHYHYFTLTNESGFSHGQVTIVLGRLESSDKKTIKAAFVDKIQGVLIEEIPYLLEAIKTSVAEYGYTLVLPIDTGGKNDLSNDPLIRFYVDTKIKSNKIFSTPFISDQSDLSFGTQFSRADKDPLVRSFETNISSKIFEKKENQVNWTLSKSHLESIYLHTYNLQYGNEIDKKKFFEIFTYLYKENIFPKKVLSSKDFKDILSSWLNDFSLSFQFRENIFSFLVEDNSEVFRDLFEFFSLEEQELLFQNNIGDFFQNTKNYQTLLNQQPILIEIYKFFPYFIKNNERLHLFLESFFPSFLKKDFFNIKNHLQLLNLEDFLLKLLEKDEDFLDTDTLKTFLNLLYLHNNYQNQGNKTIDSFLDQHKKLKTLFEKKFFLFFINAKIRLGEYVTDHSFKVIKKWFRSKDFPTKVKIQILKSSIAYSLKMTKNLDVYFKKDEYPLLVHDILNHPYQYLLNEKDSSYKEDFSQLSLFLLNVAKESFDNKSHFNLYYDIQNFFLKFVLKNSSETDFQKFLVLINLEFNQIDFNDHVEDFLDRYAIEYILEFSNLLKYFLKEKFLESN